MIKLKKKETVRKLSDEKKIRKPTKRKRFENGSYG